jgi:hypothetical protein
MTRYKKYISIIIVLISSISASAQLEVYSKFNNDGSVMPVIDYFTSKKISKKFSLTFFGLVREQWGQALIGLSYSPTNNIILYVSAGIENGQHIPRHSASIWFKKNNTTFLALYELGGGKDNYLYKVNVFHKFSSQLSIGVMDWRHHGLGPNLRYTIPKLQSTLWIMPAYDHEERVGRCMLGITVVM